MEKNQDIIVICDVHVWPRHDVFKEDLLGQLKGIRNSMVVSLSHIVTSSSYHAPTTFK